jgi:hypothetical protein
MRFRSASALHHWRARVNPPDPLEALSPLLDALADRIVDRWLASTATRMVAQTGSPLGSRKHRDAVKRRMQSGEGGASIVGRRHYLTHEALQQELGMAPRPPRGGGKQRGGDGAETAGSSPAPKPKSGGDRVSAFQKALLAKVRAAGNSDRNSDRNGNGDDL